MRGSQGFMAARRAGLLLVAVLGMSAASPAPGSSAAPPSTPPPSSEEIQRQREEAERQKLEYEAEAARREHINQKIRLWKQLQASIPFEHVPNTSNLVQVFVNGHDIRDVAWKLYGVTDGASEAGFAGQYWPTVLFLNRAKEYEGGLPLYGRLDPGAPEPNVALFPAVRQRGYEAVVAQMSAEDSAMALQMTVPVVAAWRQRLEEEVVRLAARGGEVALPVGPTSVPGENHVALFQGLATEPRDQYPPRRGATAGAFAAGETVPVDLPIPIEPEPPAMALRQGVNMLGPTYEGYNLEYKPTKLDLQPEAGPIAFLGGRDPLGNPRTQPGMHFALNQRFFDFLLVAESAFVVFGAGGAPPMNGGTVSAGLDIDLWGYARVGGILGMTALRVVGATETGPSYAGRLRVPISQHLQLGGLYRHTRIEHFRVEERDASGNLIVGRTGVTGASYFALTVSLR